MRVLPTVRILLIVDDEVSAEQVRLKGDGWSAAAVVADALNDLIAEAEVRLDDHNALPHCGDDEPTS